MSTLHRTVLIIRRTHPFCQDYENWLQPDFQVASLIWDESTHQEARPALPLPLPDVYLVDLVAAHDDGAAVLHSLKARWGLTCPPIVVVGKGAIATAVATLKAGAADYLVQDQFTPAQLRDAVQQAIAPPTKASRALELCEAQFQTSIETLQDCFGIFTAMRDEAGQILDFRIDYLNQAAVANNQMPRERQIGQGLCDVLPSHRESGLFKEYCQLVETGLPLTKDSLIYEDTYGGSQELVRVYDIRASKFRDGFVAAWRDVTERRQLESELNQTVAALRQERNRLQHLIDTAPIGIGIGTPTGEVRIANDAMLALHGCSRETFEQQGLNWRDFVSPESVAQVDQAMAQLQTEDALPPQERTLQWPDGSQVPVWVSATRWLGCEDEHAAFAVDMTCHKRVEAELRASQQRYSELAEAMPQIMWSADGDGQVNYWNQRWYEYTGLRDETSMGLDGAAVVHPDDRDLTLSQWQQAIVTRTTFEIEYRLRDRAGHYQWFICRAVPTGDGPGQITGWIGTITDIHDRKQLEQQLRQEIADHQRTEVALRSANERITGILENMTDAYIAVDLSWRITYVNQVAARINQVSPAALLHRDHWQVWPDADDEARAYYEQAIATGAPVHFEQFNATRQRWYEIHACPAPEGLGIYFRDIHDRKQADLERQQYQETICRQLAEIEAIYQSAPIGLNVLDQDLRFRRINQRLAEINGLPVEAHVGRTVREVLPDLADTAEPVLRSLLETGEPLLNVEFQGETPAQPGVQRTWLEHFIPLRQGDRIIGINTVCEEITERKQAEQALQLTKDRFELAARAVKCLIYEWDLLSGLVERTYGLKELVGYTPEEAEPTADWWANRIHPDDLNRLYTEAFWDRIQTADRISSEYRIRHRQGHYLWVQDHLLVVRNEAGQPVKIVGSSADITYRKQAELALQEAHIQLEAALAAGAVYIWRWSIPDDRVYTNRAFAQLFGVDPQGAMAGLPLADFLNAIHLEDRPRVVAAIEQAIATGEELAQEFRIDDADGQEHWVTARGRVEYDENGQAICFPGALADITEHKQTAIALQENEARLQGFVDANVVGIMQGDIYGKIAQANDEWLRIVGYSRADLMTGTLAWVDLTPPEYLSLDRERIAEAQERGACTPYEKEYLRRDGSRVPVLVGFSLVGAAREESVVFVLDLTDRKQAEKALRRSEDRLRLAIESAQLGTWDWHLLPQWLTWDDRCKAMFGLPPAAEINNDMFLEAVHPQDRQRVEQLMAAALDPDHGGRYEAEFRVIGIQDHVERWISTKGQVYFMADGTPKRFTGTALDITERKRAEVVLRDREERLELAASAAQLGVFEWHIQADETIWENPQMYEIFGHDPTEGTLSKAEFIESVVHPEDRRSLQQGFIQALKKGRLQQQVCRIRRRHDGSWRWIEINGHLTSNPEGMPLRLIGVISDITARKQADENLRLSENRYRTLANAVSQLMWVNDNSGYVQFYNQQWEAYTGLDHLELGVSLWANVIHPDDFQATAAIRSQAIQAGSAYAVECRLKRYDQTYRWHLARIVPFQDDAGQVLSWFGTATDIHDRKCAEAEREELLEREQIAREEAERANRIKDEFLAILSHELRSPLNPILGWSKLLQTRNLDAAKTAQALATIERNAKLQTQLIDDLLDIAKILRGKLKLENTPVELGFAVESAIDTVQTAAAAKSIVLQSDLPDIGQIWGDFGRIQQIVWNLLTNAIKFTPEGGRVTIQLGQVGDLAQIRVTDTGKGIRQDFLPHIFESFRQEDVSITRQHGGLGLGLAIVRYLVEAHGGTVTAASPGEGQGATFTVSLPLLQGTSQMAMPSMLNLVDLNLDGIRVLAVDDNPDSCELISMVCSQYGAEILAVNSGAACLDHLSTFQPHILISDIGMPQMDGLTLIKAIRSRPPEQSGRIPAIALTAYTREVDQKRALASGFQKHLAKPLDIEQLVQAILALLPEKRG